MIKIKLAAKIKAGQNVLEQHGEWWTIQGDTGTQYIIQSLDKTLRYARIYGTYALRTIPKDGGELFTVVSTQHQEDINENSVSENKWPILERLL